MLLPEGKIQAMLRQPTRICHLFPEDAESVAQTECAQQLPLC